MRVNTKYINSIRSTSSKKCSETSGFSRRCSCVTQLVATAGIIFACASNSNAAAAAEGAALVMQATVVRSAVLMGTVPTTNVATRN